MEITDYVELARRRYPWTIGLRAEVAAPPAGIPAEYLREMEILKARLDFPLADQDILKLLHGSAEEIRAVAEKTHKQQLAIQAAQQTPPPPQPPAPVAPAAGQPPAPAPVQPQQTTQPAPGPAPVPGPGQVTPVDNLGDARYNELKYKVEIGTAEPHERQEFFMSAYRNAWNEHTTKMAARAR